VAAQTVPGPPGQTVTGAGVLEIGVAAIVYSVFGNQAWQDVLITFEDSGEPQITRDLTQPPEQTGQ
jgi:hypothetical protein